MDWTALLSAIAQHGGALGVLFAAFGIAVAIGTAVGQWTVRASLITVTGELRGISNNLGVITSQLSAQQRIHEEFNVTLKHLTETQSILVREMAALSTSTHEEARQRSQEMMHLVTTLLTALRKGD